ncbi:hypothetical protein D9599_13205 [Roseomonas sp. KE2513]|uniref:hypothetical protein n=1 Tax=Roseomonas sp. KE2513 TaxID=2479202 RepID=UPI0018DF3776|nr:hypothetical protein [Roseomonas sp. KE2513]MBI0536534.1 hypothetical protein [Roseomonas sp. KE2513]
MLGELTKLLGRRPRRAAVDVGWVITEPKASLIWDDPEPVRRKVPRPASAKSVQACPAAIDFEARHFAVPCPIDVRLRLRLEAGKPPVIENADGAQSSIRNKALGNMVTIVSRSEWRHPDRPILQFSTPYVFVADDPVFLNQLPPFLGYTDPPWPGVQVSGRFPVHIWPRHLMWAFEWFDTSKELVLKRGQPWFYLRFEPEDPSTAVRLVEAELTPELRHYIDSIGGVTNYVNRTYALFERAAKRRPKTLLVRRG